MTKIPFLPATNSVSFPSVDKALEEPNGLLAAGGALNVNTLINAYEKGIFPWFEEGGPILWWSPDPRCIFDPRTFSPSKSLRKTISRGGFEIRVNSSFEEVIRNCKQTRRGNDSTWITESITDAYIGMHKAGHAHSLECFINDQLMGGLYGVSLGNLFFGESMFYKAKDCSKLALAGLMTIMNSHDSKMVDCQMVNSHLLSLGAKEIPRQTFIKTLRDGLNQTPINWAHYNSPLARLEW